MQGFVFTKEQGKDKSLHVLNNGRSKVKSHITPSIYIIIHSCRYIHSTAGIPPFCHGGVTPPLDVELQCLRAGLHIFVEKPISVLPPEEFSPYVDALEAAQSERGLVVSVGYMFRWDTSFLSLARSICPLGCPRSYCRPYTSIGSA